MSWVMERSHRSLMFTPPTSTDRLSFFRRLPWHSGQFTELIQPEISSRIQALFVSRKRRSRLLATPSNSVK